MVQGGARAVPRGDRAPRPCPGSDRQERQDPHPPAGAEPRVLGGHAVHAAGDGGSRHRRAADRQP